MPISPNVVFTATGASAATSVRFDVGGGYDSYSLVIPSMASGTDMQIRMSETLGGTYRILYHPRTSASSPTSFIIAQAISNCVLPIPYYLGQYIEVALTTATSDTAYDFSLICKAT